MTDRTLLVAARDALKAITRIAEEARQEWDAAPDGMKAGKLLIALTGHLPGYRKDIDDIHAVLARIEAALAEEKPE